MIKKILILFSAMFILAVPAASANDGGAYPDYNEYITYTVETDCTEIGIGEELTFTITIKNHTAAPFSSFKPGVFFRYTPVDWDGDEYYSLSEIYIEPYQTNSYDITCEVEENVWWYKEGEDYYIDLCPYITYMLPMDILNNWEEYNLPYDWFVNMVGVEPIPIKLTNLNDGSALIDAEVLNKDNYFAYYDISQTDWAESYTYEGEYYSKMANYVSIKNISEKPLKMIYIDGVSDRYSRLDESFYLYGGELIVAESGDGNEALPDEIPPVNTVVHNILFSDEEGQYYGVYTTDEYPTVVCERPQVQVETQRIEYVEDEYELVNVSITNISNEDINDFFVYYGEDFPETKQELFQKTIKRDFKAGETINLPKPLKLSWRYSYSLRIGSWNDEILDYWIIGLYRGGEKTEQSYFIDGYDYLRHVELYPLLYDIDVFDLDATIEAQKNQPDNTDEASTEPIPTETVTPASSPAPTPTDAIFVEKIRSYYVPPLAFIVLGAVAAIAVVMVVLSRRKDGEGEK